MLAFKPIKKQTSLLRKAGFTLTEIMVCVTIVSLLSATAVPTYSKFFKKAKIAEVYLGLAQIYSAEQAHFTTEEWYTANLQKVLGGAGSFFDKQQSVAVYGFNPTQSLTDPTCSGAPGSCATTASMTSPLNVTGASIKYINACILDSLGFTCLHLKPTYNPRSGPPLPSDFLPSVGSMPTHFEVNAVLDLENDGKFDVFAITDANKSVFRLCDNGNIDPLSGLATGMGAAVCQ
jgi:prepilin-type N-terminal cleavage/methylation domain-containing protein